MTEHCSNSGSSTGSQPVDEPLFAWAAARWPEHDWAAATLAHGALHQVLVGATVVARVAPSARRTAAELDLLRTVGALGLSIATPVVLDGPVDADGLSGVLLSRVPGAGDPQAPWAMVRPALDMLLEQFRRVPVDVRDDLPAPRAWCGGAEWPAIVDQLAATHLTADAGIVARRVVADVQSVEMDAPRSFVHGDLGLHNMLWRHGRLSALIDFDNACRGDHAIDLAPFVGTFGAARVRESAEPQDVDRAMTHRASLPLQVAAAAELADAPALRDHALRNFAARVAAGTLHDPDGTRA